MTKRIYLETFKSVLGRSIFHYYKFIDNPGSQVYILLSTNMGVSPLHGLRIDQICIKIDKVKIKSYSTP